MPLNCSVAKMAASGSVPTAGASDRVTVFRRKLLQPQHCDNILKSLILRKRLPDFLSEVVVPLADDARRPPYSNWIAAGRWPIEPLARPSRESTIDAER